MLLRTLVPLLVIMTLSASQAQPDQTGTGPVEVDVELVLAADNSASMFKLLPVKQQRDYAAAFRRESLFRAINSGALGRIAVIYFEWSDISSQRVVVPWTLIETREDMAGFADALEGAESKRPNGETSISGALIFSQALLEENAFSGMGATAMGRRSKAHRWNC